MGKFVINGGRRLSGKIKAQTAKNAVLPILAACVLTDGEVVIKNCPNISDVKNMLAILKGLGAKYYFSDSSLVICCDGINNYRVSEGLCGELRSSVLLAGALAAKVNRAEIAFPGGCKIGERPIGIHIDALKSLGARVEKFESGLLVTGELCGGTIVLPIPSVGATENAMLAACKAKGNTVIKNAAKEPEIVDLADFLNLLGGRIYGAGTDTIEIEGVKKLGSAEYLPIPDRIEIGTYLEAAAITGGEVEISGVKIENISALIGKLCDNSCKLTIKNDIIYVKVRKREKPFFIRTGYYPLFPTDMQPQTTALAAVTGGVSVIEESVFENRFGYAAELNKMGADISVNGKTAVVKGIKRFHGASVDATDLRGGAALLLAGLNAEGKTEINKSFYVERGYDGIENKLRALGADIVKE